MLTDEQLWANFQNGDEAAWATLQARYWAKLVRYAECRTGNRHTARLVVRKAFRRIYRWRDYTPQGFAPWVYTGVDRLSEPYWSGEFKALCAEDARLMAA